MSQEDGVIWTPGDGLFLPPGVSDVGHLTAGSERPYAGGRSSFLEDNAFDVDPSLIPGDFHNINLEDAVRLTPATLAFHISQGLWQPADHLLYLASEIAKELLEGNAHLIVSMPPRHGKPIWIEEKILLGNGSYVRLGDVKVGDEVITHLGRPRKVLNVFEQGKLPCLEIKTKFGRAARGAQDHPFFTHRGWVTLADLRPGDNLAAVKEAKITSPPSQRSAEEFRLAGYFIGDGACSYNQGGSSVNANITCKDEILLKDIYHCTEASGFTIKYSCRYNHQLSGGVRDWLRDIGLAGTTSHTKKVPEWVLSAPLELALQFVGAYYECDGSIDKLGPQKQPTPTFNSVSLELLRGVQSILLRAGINARIHGAGVKVKGRPYLSFRLVIGSHGYLKKLFDIMPCFGEKGIRSKERVEVFFNTKERKAQREVWADNFLHDVVDSVTNVGEFECRCLEVEEDHTFTVNDLVVHNSELLSVWTALWWLDLFPEDLILLATYGADLSQGFSRRVRDTLIELGGIDDKPSPEHKLGGRPRLRTHVRSDISQAGHFLTPQGGGMTAVGLGGSITGRGANLLFIDDYVKNAEDAASPTNQQKNFDWFVSTAYTRLEPGGSVIVLATRWEAQDLIGKLKANQHEFSGTWRIIELPALAYGGKDIDPLGRAAGEPLWPQRYPLARLLQIRSMLGQFFWASLYQQRPIKRSDVKFEDELLESTSDIPSYSTMRMLRSWDLAGTAGGGDWTVGALLGQDGPPKRTSTKTYIGDIERGQWGQAVLEQKILDVAEADGPGVPIFIEQEPGSSGKNYANYLAETVLRDYTVKVKPPSSDKWLKAQPFFACVARGNARMRSASWNGIVRDEFKGFTGASSAALHDDIVDAVSQGYNELTSSGPVSATWGRNAERQQDSAIMMPKKLVRGAVFGRSRHSRHN